MTNKTKITVNLPRLHAVQKHIDKNRTRYTVISCARRVGKTTYLVNKIIEALVNGKRVGYWLPTFKYLPTVWQMILDRIPQEILLSSNKTDKIIETTTGGHLRIHSCERVESGRGEKYHLALIDEASLVAALEVIWEATISPTLVDYTGELIVTGTPKGKNFFYVMAQKSKFDPQWSSFTARTIDNPHLPKLERDRIAALPDTPYNRQEYKAEFLEDGGDLFGPLTIVQKLKPSALFKIGVDLAKSQDFTVVSVFNEFNQQVLLERWNTMSWTAITEKIQNILDKFPDSDIVVDATGVGSPICDALEHAGYNVERFIFTAPSRYKILEGIALLIDNGQVEFIDDEVQTAEFEAFGRYQKRGAVKLLSSAPHDDIVMAAALAMSVKQTPFAQIWS